MAQTSPVGCIVASALTILISIVLLIGALTIANHSYYLRDYWTQIYGLSIFSIVIGVLAILAAIGLIYVVNRQFPALTTLFSGLLIFIAFLAVICIVILTTGRHDLERKTYYNTEKLFRNYSDSNLIKSSKLTFGYIQQSFQCCGVERATDWKNRSADPASTPDSCCKVITVGCGKGSLIKQDKIYSRGCAQLLYGDFRKKYSILISINITLIVFALLSAVLGIVYERYIRERYQAM